MSVTWKRRNTAIRKTQKPNYTKTKCWNRWCLKAKQGTFYRFSANGDGFASLYSIWRIAKDVSGLLLAVMKTAGLLTASQRHKSSSSLINRLLFGHKLKLGDNDSNFVAAAGAVIVERLHSALCGTIGDLWLAANCVVPPLRVRLIHWVPTFYELQPNGGGWNSSDAHLLKQTRAETTRRKRPHCTHEAFYTHLSREDVSELTVDVRAGQGDISSAARLISETIWNLTYLWHIGGSAVVPNIVPGSSLYNGTTSSGYCFYTTVLWTLLRLVDGD